MESTRHVFEQSNNPDSIVENWAISKDDYFRMELNAAIENYETFVDFEKNGYTDRPDFDTTTNDEDNYDGMIDLVHDSIDNAEEILSNVMKKSKGTSMEAEATTAYNKMLETMK